MLTTSGKDSLTFRLNERKMHEETTKTQVNFFQKNKRKILEEQYATTS